MAFHMKSFSCKKRKERVKFDNWALRHFLSFFVFLGDWAIEILVKLGLENQPRCETHGDLWGQAMVKHID